MYHAPQGESAENLELMRRVDELFLKYPFYGSRQMVRHLWRDGVRVGRDRARRLMRVTGLQAIYQAPRTTTRHPQHRNTPRLGRHPVQETRTTSHLSAIVRTSSGHPQSRRCFAGIPLLSTHLNHAVETVAVHRTFTGEIHHAWSPVRVAATNRQQSAPVP